MSHFHLPTVRRPAPKPPNAANEARMAEAGERLALLTGRWQHSLHRHVRAQLGALRARLVGAVDISANLAKSVTDQVSTLFDIPPDLRHENPPALEAMRAQMDRYWPLGQRHQKHVTLLRESLVRVGYDPEMKRLSYKLVTPNLVWAVASRFDLSRPVLIAEARLRPIPGDRKKEEGWFWDVWDIRDPQNPSFSILSDDLTRDMTLTFGIKPEEWQGDAYPYRDETGPILPYQLYHAEATGQLWDGMAHSEVVFGTLQVGLLWTATIHGFLRASWDQRYLINGQIVGGATEKVGGKNTRLITPDPTKIIEIRSGEGGAQAGAWGASIDIDKAEGVVRRYEARLAVHFGLSPADLVIESLNPASGASITVSRDGKRALQARAVPQFRIGDMGLIRVSAIVGTAHDIPGLVPDGYSLRYAGIALLPAERKLVNDYLKPEFAQALIDRVAAYAELHPGVSLEEATADLEAQRLRIEKATIADSASDAPSAGTIELAPTDVAIVVTVDEARASQGLGPWPVRAEGSLTVSEFKARKETEGAVIGEAVGEAEATDGAPEDEDGAPEDEDGDTTS